MKHGPDNVKGKGKWSWPWPRGRGRWRLWKLRPAPFCLQTSTSMCQACSQPLPPRIRSATGQPLKSFQPSPCPPWPRPQPRPQPRPRPQPGSAPHPRRAPLVPLRPPQDPQQPDRPGRGGRQSSCPRLRPVRPGPAQSAASLRPKPPTSAPHNLVRPPTRPPGNAATAQRFLGAACARLGGCAVEQRPHEEPTASEAPPLAPPLPPAGPRPASLPAQAAGCVPPPALSARGPE